MIREKLIKRSQALQKARQFFLDRDLIETDCLILGQSASIDMHIDLFEVASPIHGRRFLFSSPEYPMKRLLGLGSGDIFYLGHVFRHEEAGRLHSPEFTIAEWYRVGFSFQEMIHETVSFILDTLLGNESRHENTSWTTHQYTYEEVFLAQCGFNPHLIAIDSLRESAKKILDRLNIETPFSLSDSSRDEILHLLMSLCIEPSFRRTRSIIILSHYPASQASLAQTCLSSCGTYSVSERFEIYVEGVEVANGYHELIDPVEQRKRFIDENALRATSGKEEYPLDERFLRALESRGFPPCCGVAVGFDRLLMTALKAESIGDVMPLPWTEA